MSLQEIYSFINFQQRGWLISPSQHVIFKNDRVQQEHDPKNVIPRENMIHYSLNYARELVSII